MMQSDESSKFEFSESLSVFDSDFSSVTFEAAVEAADPFSVDSFSLILIFGREIEKVRNKAEGCY